MPRLTDTSIRQLPLPDKGQKLYYDTALPSFGVRVSQGGTRSFFIQCGTDRRFITLGRYGIDTTLAEAREQAKRILAQRTLGHPRPHPITWDEAVAVYLSAARQKNRPRTVADYQRLLNRHFPFKTTRMTDITTHLINERLDRIAKTVSEYNHALVAVEVFCKWAQGRGYIHLSPCHAMQIIRRPPRENPTHRHAGGAMNFPKLAMYECRRCGALWQKLFRKAPWFHDYSIRCRDCRRHLEPYHFFDPL